MTWFLIALVFLAVIASLLSPPVSPEARALRRERIGLGFTRSQAARVLGVDIQRIRELEGGRATDRACYLAAWDLRMAAERGTEVAR